ncbi:MAG: prepilin-type N-terminal cleavage/methylation domain-containing protein [Candidatus Gastranaerophilales bacterium]|nr:prepilin-type N-terminal cleavage/methylation domain-containing protein [Candidatus Gastranaerophilales bacterium]
MVKKSKGFTLVESIISMIVIAVVATGCLTSITKTKARIESVTIRGQYGCWYDNAGNLHEAYYDERTQRSERTIPAGDNCRLVLDQRPAHFYILASGAGNSESQGQVATVYTPAISNELQIHLGKSGSDNLTTTVSNGDLSVAVANGPKTGEIINNIIPANVKSCKIVSSTDASCTPKTCEVISVINFSGTGFSDEYKIRINGCSEGVDEYGNPIAKTISFSSANFSGINQSSNFTNVSNQLVNFIADANPDAYTAITDDGSATYTFSLEYYDSSYVPPRRQLSFTNNTQEPYGGVSKMSRILDTISVRRKSDLTDRLLGLNAGAKNNNGAVLILW